MSKKVEHLQCYFMSSGIAPIERIFRKLKECKSLPWTEKLWLYIVVFNFFLSWCLFCVEFFHIIKKCSLHFSKIFQLVTINNSQLPECPQQYCVVPFSVESIERGSDNCLDVIQVRRPLLHQVQKFLENEADTQKISKDYIIWWFVTMSKRFI